MTPEQRELAACKGVDTRLFHPTNTQVTHKKAKAICAECQVKAECLEMALNVMFKWDTGVYGGTTQKERINMRRELKKGAEST